MKGSTDVSQFPSDGVSTTNAQVAAAAVKAVKAGHAKDVDIAAQILAQYGNENDRNWSEEEEKKLIRKVDWMIVPIVRCSNRHETIMLIFVLVALCLCYIIWT